MKKLIETVKNFRFTGVFFTKEDIDYTNKHVDIGFRYSTGERNFTDVHFYPKMKIKRTSW